MSASRRLACLLAYDGREFYGFQRQPGMPTVQEELEQAWLAVSAERTVMHGSGRTDTGVHAWGQVVHFNTWSTLPSVKVRAALNAYLPEEMAVREVREVPPDFHSRGSAIGKRYLYALKIGAIRPVLEAGRVAWDRAADLDVAAMRAAVPYLLGTHDFAAFVAAGHTTKTSVRTLQAIHIRRTRWGLVWFFQGDGFLYKMVRILVGTFLEVGKRRRAPEWVDSVLQAGDRKRAGTTAPPEGLYLWKVLYRPDPFLHTSPISAIDSASDR